MNISNYKAFKIADRQFLAFHCSLVRYKQTKCESMSKSNSQVISTMSRTNLVWISPIRNIIHLKGSIGRARQVPLFNREVMLLRSERKLQKTWKGTPGGTFIMVKWERGAWYRQCVIELRVAKRKRGRSCPCA